AAGVTGRAREVGPGAEGPVPGAGEHDDAHLVVLLGLRRRFAQSGDDVPRHGVAALGPVDRHPGHVPVHFIQQCPVHHWWARYFGRDMRFTLIALGIGFVLALALGGRPRHLAGRSFTWWLLLPVGLALQVLAVQTH